MKRDKTLYEFFGCETEQELYEKMKNNDPSVVELQKFYRKHSYIQDKDFREFNSQQELMKEIVNKGHIPVEGGYSVIGFNHKIQYVSSTKFTEEDSFREVVERLNNKGFSRVAIIENKPDEENYSAPRYEEEFKSMGVELVDAFFTSRGSEPGEYRLESMLHYDSHQLMFQADDIVNENSMLKYSPKKEKSISHLDEYDTYSFYFAQKELKGLNIFEDKDRMEELLLIGNSGFGKEHLQVLTYDQNYDVENLSIESIGSVSSTVAHPLGMLDTLLNTSKGFIVLHNHPSGSTEPSIADSMMTERFLEVSENLDIEMLDHLIIGDDVLSIKDEYHEDWADKLKERYRLAKEEYYSDSQMFLMEDVKELPTLNIKNRRKEIEL